ncbi:MAG: ATP synthase F1 subunit delta [Proteobacteria bacterium]|nr:ATP synthase F1 subunit delta [Pseudomonadota bacterium]
MSAAKIARRYAVALQTLTAGERALEDKIIYDLQEIAGLYSNKAIKKIIASPIVSQDLLNEIFGCVEKQMQSPDILRKFLGTLVEHRRTALLPELAGAFRKLVQQSRGQVDALVTAAVVLEEGELNSIKSNLESLLHKKINLVQALDDSILGGFVIRVENSVLDISLKTKLEHMTKFAVS